MDYLNLGLDLGLKRNKRKIFFNTNIQNFVMNMLSLKISFTQGLMYSFLSANFKIVDFIAHNYIYCFQTTVLEEKILA